MWLLVCSTVGPCFTLIASAKCCLWASRYLQRFLADQKLRQYVL